MRKVNGNSIKYDDEKTLRVELVRLIRQSDEFELNQVVMTQRGDKRSEYLVLLESQWYRIIFNNQRKSITAVRPHDQNANAT
jgi:hypothetical protein